MAGWTKADYDAAYKLPVERLLGGYPSGATRPQMVVHYHRFFIQELLSLVWARLAPVLAFNGTEKVCIVGAGFGWGVEAFIAETGCVTVGIDISDYIHAEKDNTEETELRQEVINAGLDPDTGTGAFLLSQVYDGQPRTDPSIVVLQEDMQTNTSRNAIRSALGGWPDVVIFEDLVDDNVTDQEITQANNAANLFAGTQRVIWVYRPTLNRSLQDLQTLTGEEVISPDGQTHLVP